MFGEALFKKNRIISSIQGIWLKLTFVFKISHFLAPQSFQLAFGLIAKFIILLIRLSGWEQAGFHLF